MPDSVALIFPGQGSHAPGMEEPYADAAAITRGRELLGSDPFARLDEGTRAQQPAIFLCSVAAWELAGEPVDVIGAAGHSLGEYAALTCAGVLRFEDALQLVQLRAEAMDAADAREPGGMVAVLGGEEEAVRALGRRHGLRVANDNAPGQLVLSGPREGVERTAAEARGVGARARILSVSGACHSPVMEPAAEELAAALADVPLTPPRFPVISNGTSAPFTDVRSELVHNLVAPVRWRESVIALQRAGAERFLELGPGRVLTGLVERTLREAA